MSETNPLAGWIERYFDDPVAFVREVIGMEPRAWQIEFLTAIATGKRRISVRSGHRVGKSTAVGWAMVWYLLTRYRVKIAVTAPSKQQMYDALWAEFQSTVAKLPAAVQELVEVQSSTAFLKAAKADAFITAATARAEQPEALAGKHSDFVMLIGDEASGIPDPVFESALGSMAAENAVMILLGNPIRSTGFFFDTHHRAKDRWFAMHVSAVDYASPEWVEDMRAMYGEQSNAFRVRVLGEFPRADDNAAIPYDYVVSARGRDIEALDDEPEIWGLDVARGGGDHSALVRRRGRVVPSAPEIFPSEPDTMVLVGQVLARWEALPEKRRPEAIYVDAIGLGASVADRLRELGLPIRAVNVSETAAMGSAIYSNLKAELWFKARAWFEGKDVALPVPAVDDPRRDTTQRLIDELVAMQTDHTVKGAKVKIQSKKEFKKAFGRSCDAADAFVLTFAGPAATASGRGVKRSWTKPIRRALKGIV